MILLIQEYFLISGKNVTQIDKENVKQLLNNYRPISLLAIFAKMLKLIKSFLSERYHGVLRNKQSSGWGRIKVGVPKGSNLGPLLF